MPVSIYVSKELQTLLLAMREVDKETAKVIRRETKAMIEPAWKKAVTEHASTRLEQRVLAQTARVAVSNQNVTLKAATVGRRLSGGLDPKTQYYAAEFGADARGTKFPVVTHSRRGREYTAHRRTRAQLRARKKSGYAVYPAEADVVPRLFALWVQTWVRGLHDAFEKAG